MNMDSLGGTTPRRKAIIDEIEIQSRVSNRDGMGADWVRISPRHSLKGPNVDVAGEVKTTRSQT